MKETLISYFFLLGGCNTGGTIRPHYFDPNTNQTVHYMFQDFN